MQKACGTAAVVGGYVFVAGTAATVNGGGWAALFGLAALDSAAAPVIAISGVAIGAVGLACLVGS